MCCMCMLLDLCMVKNRKETFRSPITYIYIEENGSPYSSTSSSLFNIDSEEEVPRYKSHLGLLVQLSLIYELLEIPSEMPLLFLFHRSFYYVCGCACTGDKKLFSAPTWDEFCRKLVADLTFLYSLFSFFKLMFHFSLYLTDRDEGSRKGWGRVES